MFYVYLLASTDHAFSYVGSTNDVGRRLAEHNTGLVKSTRPYLPLQLVYYEAYQDVRDAAAREKRLKCFGSAIGRLKQRLPYSLHRSTQGAAPLPLSKHEGALLASASYQPTTV